MGFPWGLGSLWGLCGVPMGLRGLYGVSMSLYGAEGSLWGPYGVPMGLGVSMGSPWG